SKTCDSSLTALNGIQPGLPRSARRVLRSYARLPASRADSAIGCPNARPRQAHAAADLRRAGAPPPVPVARSTRHAPDWLVECAAGLEQIHAECQLPGGAWLATPLVPDRRGRCRSRDVRALHAHRGPAARAQERGADVVSPRAAAGPGALRARLFP